MSYRDVINNVSFLIGFDGEPWAIKRAIENIYQDILRRHQWSFLKKEEVFSTLANYSTGTVAVTSGSKTVTGTGTSWDSTHVGAFIRVDSSGTFYKISAVGGATDITLQDNYAGSTDTGLSYVIFKHIYTLNDVRELFSISYQTRLREKSVDWLNKNDPEKRFISTNPERFAKHVRTLSTSIDIELSPVPSGAIGVRAYYLQHVANPSADSDTFLIPEWLIEKFTLAAMIKRKALGTNDFGLSRMYQQEFLEAEKSLQEMINEDNRNWGAANRVRIDSGYEDMYSDDIYYSHDVDFPF